MDKAKILQLLDEADDIVSALYRQGANKDYKCKALREKLKAVAAEINAPPKSNADRIRQMTDEELAEWFAPLKKLIDKDTAKMPIRRRNPHFGDEIETFCPNCGLMLDSPDMSSARAYKLRNDRCADCGQRLASEWWTLHIPITEDN